MTGFLHRRAARLALLGLAMLAGVRAEARGRFSSGELPVPEAPPPAVLKRAGWEQKLDAQVPMDLTFKDEAGRSVTLRELTQGKPIILNLAYYECPMLCIEVMNGLLEAMKEMNLECGKDYTVLTVSFDPGEGPDLATKKKANYAKSYGRGDTEKGWRFLTGAEKEIAQLCASVGFQYAYDEKTDQYGHASGILVLTPEGKTSHYFYGVMFSSRDLRLALVDASAGKIGTPVDQLLLLCYHYDPISGKYSMTVMNLVRAGGVLTVLGLVALVGGLARKGRRATAAGGGGPAA